MSLEDFHRLDSFLMRFPPVDVLVAAYLGYKEPGSEKKRTPREAIKMNTEALAQMPPRRNAKTLAQMPAFLRSQQFMGVIEDLKQKCQTS